MDTLSFHLVQGPTAGENSISSMKFMFEEVFRELFLTVESPCSVCMGVKGEGGLWCTAGVLTQYVSFSLLSLEYNLQP